MLQDGRREKKKEEAAGGDPLCWRATNGSFLFFFKRHRRGVPRRERRGMFNDKRLWEKTDESRVGFSSVPTSELNASRAHLSST